MRIAFLLAMAVIVLSSVPLLQPGMPPEAHRNSGLPAFGAAAAGIHPQAASTLNHVPRGLAPAAGADARR